MSIEQLQQLSGRSVVRDGIASRAQAVEIIVARCVGVEAAAEVHVWLVWVLLLVQAVGRRVPDVDFDVGDGLACVVVCDRAVHVGHVAALVFVDDRVSEGSLGGTLAPERAENLKSSELDKTKMAGMVYLQLLLWVDP